MSEELKRVELLLEKLIEHRKPERYGVIERHAQTLVMSLLTVGIVWLANNSVTTSSDVKVLQVQVESMHRLLERDDSVSRGEFAAHIENNDRRLKRLEDHVQIDEQGWRPNL